MAFSIDYNEDKYMLVAQELIILITSNAAYYYFKLKTAGLYLWIVLQIHDCGNYF